MSYLYDKLKEALGGNKLTESRSAVISDWTPNALRALIITRYGIITVNHLGVFGGCTKLVPLDVVEVAKDLEEISRTNYGKPKLNGLLTKRSFSCLEEIYVDAMFQNYTKVFDLVAYAKELMGANSRLRYFGYGDFSNVDCQSFKNYLNQVYKESYSKGNYGYSLAKDNGRPVKLEFKDVGNTLWYEKYFLRPQFYKKDNAGGDLSIHFRKIEVACHNSLESMKEAEENSSYLDKFRTIINRDLQNKEYLAKLDKLIIYMKSRKADEVIKILQPVVLSCLTGKTRIVAGLSLGLLARVFNSDGAGVPEDIKDMGSYYSVYKIKDDKDGAKPDVDKYLKGKDGFIPLGQMLDALCCEIVTALSTKGYKELAAMSAYTCSGVPDGEFARKYTQGKTSNDNGYNGYFEFIGNVIGIDLSK